LSGGRVTADVGDDGVGRLDSADRLLRESAADDVVVSQPHTGAAADAEQSNFVMTDSPRTPQLRQDPPRHRPEHPTDRTHALAPPDTATEVPAEATHTHWLTNHTCPMTCTREATAPV
jgi:hypothetical protein